MPSRYAPDGPIVLVGGSGVVGRELAPLLSRLEARPVVIAARSADRAAAALQAVRDVGGHATFLAYHVGAPLEVAAAAVVGLVNDPEDVLLRSAVAARVPFVDITRWTSRVALTLGRFALAPPESPVVLASGWMGGLLPRVVRALVEGASSPVVSVDGAVRYALADASGADSVDYLDRLWIPFEVPEPRGSRVVEPFRDRRCVHVDGRATHVYRFDTPEQWTLPLGTQVPAAAVRLGFDSSLAGLALWTLVRLGIFRVLRSERFRPLRHALLRASGAEQRAGARSAFRVDVRFADGSVRSRTLAAAGQARLTAVGAWLAVKQALAALPGAHLPEQDPDYASLLETRLPAAGISATEEG